MNCAYLTDQASACGPRPVPGYGANQPEAVAFYRSLGYHEAGRETRPEWSWTLVYFIKPLP
jgi:hypothetical protein